MLQDKNFDLCLIGHNPMTYLVSLLVNQQGRDVVHIDDHRFCHGPAWSLYLSELEKKTLQLWGKELSLPPLQEIENYLTPSPIFLHLNQRRLKLGQQPEDNLKEIFCNLWEMFTGQQEGFNFSGFNKEMDDLTQSIVQDLFANPQAQKKQLGYQKKYGQISPIFQRIYQHSLRESKRGPQSLQSNLLYAAQFLWHQQISDLCSEWELFYLLTSLLTPRYRVEEEKFKTSLIKSIKDQRIAGKQDKVNLFLTNVELKVKTPHSFVKLDSYEGLVAAQEVWIFGNPALPQSSFPFHFPCSWPQYSLLEMSFAYPTNLFQDYEGSRHLYSLPQLMGSEMPLFSLSFSSANHCEISVLIPERPCETLFYYIPLAKDLVFQKIRGLFPLFDPDQILGEVKAHKGKDSWVDTKKTQLEVGKIHRNAQSLRPWQEGPITFQNLPGARNKRKMPQFKYWGPLQVYPLGQLSFLYNLWSLRWEDSSRFPNLTKAP